MAQDASLTIRLPAGLKVALERAASREFRSLSQYVVVVLAEHLGVRNEHPRPRSTTGARNRARRNAKRSRS